ncbi:MAG: type II secretion system protein [Planctomycetota bacterium]
MEGSIIARRDYNLGRKAGSGAGFTLLELLVVVSIISLLMTILVPVLWKARRQAQSLLKMNNKRQIVGAVNCFANDHDDRYPESTAKLGTDQYWVWQDPRMIAGHLFQSSETRSLGTHLLGYIDDASIVFCPSAPEEFKYLQEAWDAGDAWDNPDTPPGPDPLFGTYCFYWNYMGYLDEDGGVFRGSIGPGGGVGQSSVLVSDYFGYDHWRSRHCFGSCEPLQGGHVTEGTDESSAYWSLYDSDGAFDAGTLEIELQAGYLDGHVSKYGTSDVAGMRVLLDAENHVPNPVGVGPGLFYLPREGLE